MSEKRPTEEALELKAAYYQLEMLQKDLIRQGFKRHSLHQHLYMARVKILSELARRGVELTPGPEPDAEQDELPF